MDVEALTAADLEQSDEATALRARHDRAAFAELYVQHRERVFRYLRARCASDDDALERLTAWASPAGFGQSIVLTDDRRLAEASLRYQVPPSVEVGIHGARLTVGPEQHISGDLVHEARIAVNVAAQFELETPATIDEIGQRFLKPLMHLLVLAVQRPTSLVVFRVATDRGPWSGGN